MELFRGIDVKLRWCGRSQHGAGLGGKGSADESDKKRETLTGLMGGEKKTMNIYNALRNEWKVNTCSIPTTSEVQICAESRSG